MNLQNVHYVFPESLYLMFVVPFFGLLAWWLYFYRQKMLSKMASKEMLSTIAQPRDGRLYTLKTILIALAWIAAVFALMQPVGYGRYPAELSVSQKTPKDNPQIVGKRSKPREIILYVDTSGSMAVADMQSGRTRLDAAMDIGDAIFSRLTGESIALDAFGTEVTQLAPLTNDYLYVRLLLRDLKINETGTAGTQLSSVLKSIHDQYTSQPKEVSKSFVIFSDGGDTEIESLKGETYVKAIQNLVKEVADASQYNARIFTVGLGTSDNKSVPDVLFEGKSVISNVNEEILKAISQASNGAFYLASQYSSLDLASELAQEFAKSISGGDQASIVSGAMPDNLIYDRYYQWPLAFAIFCLAFALLLPETWQKEKL